MTGIPDYTLEGTYDFKFTTRRFSTGAPFALAGTPVVSAYPDNSTTQLTAGITLSVDFDSVTGLNNVRVVATGANGYAAGSTYHLVITTGTVDSVSVVGEVVGAFSLGRSAAAVDLANGTDGLGAIKTDTAAILVDTGTTLDGRIPAALVSGRMDASVGAMAANVLTATAIAADAITAAKVAADVSAEIADAVWDEATAGHTTAGTFGEQLKTDVDAILADTGTDGVVVAAASKTGYSLTATTGLGNQTANITGNLSGSVGSVTGAVGSVTGAVGSVTGNVGGNVTGSVGSLAAQAKADVNAEAVDALRTDTGSEHASVPAAAASVADQIQWLYQALRNKRDTTASADEIHNDAGTVVATAALSDDATTFSKGKYA